MFDIQKLTLGELAKVEELAGLSMSALGDDAAPKGLALAALAMVVKRRQQMAEGLPPKFSWNEALGLATDEAMEILGMNIQDADADADTEDGDTDGDAPDFGTPDPTPAVKTRKKS